MQDACVMLYDKLAALDMMAKQVKELRQKVEQLHLQVNARIKVHSPDVGNGAVSMP